MATASNLTKALTSARSVSVRRSRKQPFEIHSAVERLREAVRPFAKAALFELADDGFSSVFELLVACIISIRTLDEVTLPTARKLFSVARTPQQVSQLTVEGIDELIKSSSFHTAKARSIHEIALEAVRQHGGTLPCDGTILRSLRGVGPKCANLVLGIACGQPSIAVDIHVHRVTNRWGWVRAKSPEETMAVLEGKLPREYWVEINRLLVPFGKHICTRLRPLCSTCPLLEMCQQVGVGEHR
jgi:endonuclease-3